MFAAKHFDPQLGIDLHSYAVPPGTWPTPHIGIVLDPFDYIPFIGATVKVGGVRRATAGTGGVDLHILVGTPVPPPKAPMGPQFDDELFMGSMTVLADGDPFSRIAMPVLDCNLVGLIPPFRLKKAAKPKPLSLTLPTALNIAIPTNVFVGGPPMISLTAMLFKGALAALKGLGKLYKAVARRVFKNMPSGFLKCKILRAEPVDIRDGSVSVEHLDFEIPGRLPLAWVRNYSSAEERTGACGHGWDTPADLRLELSDDGSVSFYGPGQVALFPHLPAGDAADDGMVLDLFDGARLLRAPAHWVVQTRGGLRYAFARDRQAPAPMRPGMLALIERIADANGNYWHFERRGVQLTRIVEGTAVGQTGRVIEVQSSPQGLIESMALIDPATGVRHPLVSYQYAGTDLDAAIDALGAPRRFAYQEHRMVRHTNRGGLSFYYAYDPQWRVEHAWGDGGLYDYRFAYNELLRQTEVTDSLGHTTVVKFDENNLPLCEIDPLGGVTVFEYDDAGRTVAVTAPEGLRTSFDYDAYGNLLCTTLPNGSTTRTAYNDDHKPVTITDPEGGQWRQEWDTRGNLTGQTTPGGIVTQYEYTKHGDLLHVIDSAKQRTTLRYDMLGFLAGLTDPTGQRTELEHDARGNLLRKQLANGDTTHYRYDAKNRLVESILPDTRRIQCAYSAEDKLIRYSDEGGRVTQFSYYCQGSLQGRTDPDGSKVEYHYDTEEQLIGVTNQRGQRWQLKRDAAGRLVEEIDYWGQSRQCDYNPAGYLTRSTDPLGQVLAITCDKLGRIIKKQASEQDAETYRYNKRGQLTQAQNPFSTVKRQYNQDGQLTQETQEQADAIASMAYAYDPAGRLVEQTQQFSHRQRKEIRFKHTQQYTYNALSQPESVQIDEHEPIRFTFDEIGRLAKQRLNEHLTQHYRYNQAGQLTNQASTFKGQLQTRIDYDYDDAGNLIRRNDSQLGVDQYRYDLLGQITSHTDPIGAIRQLVYDKTGDRFKTVKEDEQGRTLKHEDGGYWRLDKAGQLIQKQDAEGRDSFLEWDAYGRLRRFVPGDESDGDCYEYIYDALGRRISKAKVVDPENNTQKEATWFSWDGDVMVGEMKRQEVDVDTVAKTDLHDVILHEANPDSVIPRETKRSRGIYTALTTQLNSKWQAQFYTYHLGSFVPLAMQTQTPEGKDVGKSLYFYQNDPNGMPLRLQNEDGIIKWEAHYSAFGLVDRLSVGVVEQPLRLQGQYFDSESGLHYNRYRYYDAGVGFFINADPIGLLGGLNPYQFAPNVLGWIDPWGLTGDPAKATHITYVGYKDGKPYIGYASKPGLGHSAQDVLDYRYSGDFSDFSTKPSPVYVGEGIEGKHTARGLEQRLFEDYGGLDKTANKQNPVGEHNKNRTSYLEHADTHRANNPDNRKINPKGCPK